MENGEWRIKGAAYSNYNWVWAKPTINSQFSTLNSPLNKGENYEHLA
jgi:hypothetical protein